ncbi:carboxypeptidase Y-deficient [Tulasnella sp. 403]|nr:carboxypeptidase Y-deficient [Tulasnella sp. 403]
MPHQALRSMLATQRTRQPKRHSRASSSSVVPADGTSDTISHDGYGAAKPTESSRLLRLNGNGNTANGSSRVGSPLSNSSVSTPPSDPAALPVQLVAPETPTRTPSTQATSAVGEVLRTKSVSPLTLDAPSNSVPEVDATLTTPVQATPMIHCPKPLPVDVTPPNQTSDPTVESLGRDGMNGTVSPTPTASTLPIPSSPSGSQSQLRPFPRSGGSTFRHIPHRSSKPSTSSPLRPSAATRTFSVTSQPPATGKSRPPPPPLTASQSLHQLSRPPVITGFSRPTSQSSISSSSSTPLLSTPSSPSPATSSGITSSTAQISSSLQPPSRSPTVSDIPTPKTSTPPSPAIVSTASVPYEVRQSASLDRIASPSPSSATLPATRGANVISKTSTSTETPGQKLSLTPYRPGFQPKGVYSSRTDDFLSLRDQRLSSRRTEEKRLLRRLEKLVNLHFAPHHASTMPQPSRRSSSFLDFSDIKGKGATDLWKGMVESVESSSAKHDRRIRDAEQSITHWEDDKDVSACPICS